MQQNKNNNDLSIRVLTETENNFKLSNPQLLEIPLMNPNNLRFEINNVNNDADAECNNVESPSCYQSFIISSHNVNECPLDLEGTFKIAFDILCNNILNNQCSNEINKIELQTGVTYKDEICNSQVFNINLITRKMRFYRDEQFQNEMHSTDLYDIHDTCFVQIELSYPSASVINDISNIQLENVWLCTAPPQENNLFSFSKQGCFQHNIIDQDGPFWIIKNHGDGEALFNAKILQIETVINDEDNDQEMRIIRFKFEIPAVNRDKLYIHTQLSLTFGFQEQERRRMLQQIVSKYITVVGSTNVERNLIVPFNDININNNYNKKILFIPKELLLVILVFLCCLLTISMKTFGNTHANNELEQDNAEVNTMNNNKKKIRMRKRKQYDIMQQENDLMKDEYDTDEDFCLQGYGND